MRVKVCLENDRDVFLVTEGQLKPEALRRVEIDALVDTSAVMLLLPQDVVETLGLERVDGLIVALADEQRIELDVAATVSLSIGNRKMKTDCLVGPPQCEPLVGQIVLERLDLVVDPIRRTVQPRPESPYLPSLKLK